MKDNSTKIRKRISALLLALIMSVTMMPGFAFAEDAGTQEAERIKAAAVGDGAADAEESADIAAAGTDQSSGQAAAESADENADENADTAGDDASGSEDVGANPDYTDDASEYLMEQVDEGAEEIGFELLMPGAGLADSDDLLEQYIEKQSGVDIKTPDVTEQSSTNIVRKMRLMSRRTVLTTSEQKMYDGLKAGVTRIANGETSSATVSFAMTNTDYSSCDFEKVTNSLMTDLPYELYWYDKTAGVLRGYSSGGRAVFYFSVAKTYRGSLSQSIEYSANGDAQTFYLYNTDLSKTRAASAAVANAKKIVARYSGSSDYDKLDGYRKEICSLTSYNRSASLSDDYGDPWQLIYVFDGDSDTNVVCEGYAKAFQFLCDASTFSNDTIECFTLTGKLDTRSGQEGHMWNVLHMDDGRNYIADITNCDSGTVGAPDKVFLRGYDSGSAEEGYGYIYNSTYRKPLLTYHYDEDAYSLYYDVELAMSAEDYSALSAKVTHHPAVSAACIRAGSIEYWEKEGKFYSDRYCTSEITRSQTAARALGHRWYVSANTLDYTTYRCSRCGSSYSVSKVIVDLPRVTIRKPGRARASFTAKWKKVSKKNRKKIGGIEIQYSTRRDFASSYTVTTARKTAASKRFKKLSRKTTYFVRVRSYKWIGGKKHVSAWSAVKSVKTR